MSSPPRAIGGTSQVTSSSATGSAVVGVESEPTIIRLSKTAAPRDIKVGELVRYTLVIENTGTTNVIDGMVVDTPPAGFNYVDGSLTVADADGAGRLVGTYPIRVDQIDIPAGGRATLVYLLRVGAGVRPGVHVNSAYFQDGGAIVSNVASAEVQLVGDPLLDEALIVGTVFDDRDGDGWQDSAAIGEVRVQGGFAANAYVANSTSVDRGNGAQAQADASAPMMHGIELGSIPGRQSDADRPPRIVGERPDPAAIECTDDFRVDQPARRERAHGSAGRTRIERNPATRRG